MNRAISRLVVLLAIGVVAALASISGAQAYDTDGNGYHDFLLREQPFFRYANVGAKCEHSYLPGRVAGRPYYDKITVRPPRVWSLWGLSGQRVAWRATFFDAYTGTVVHRNPWHYSTASPSFFTDFGGGPNAPDVMITWNQYWQGGQYHERYHDGNHPLKAAVDVAWQNPYTGTWTYNSAAIQWYLLTSTTAVLPSYQISGC